MFFFVEISHLTRHNSKGVNVSGLDGETLLDNVEDVVLVGDGQHEVLGHPLIPAD